MRAWAVADVQKRKSGIAETPPRFIASFLFCRSFDSYYPAFVIFLSLLPLIAVLGILVTAYFPSFEWRWDGGKPSYFSRRGGRWFLVNTRCHQRRPVIDHWMVQADQSGNERDGKRFQSTKNATSHPSRRKLDPYVQSLSTGSFRASCYFAFRG